MRRKNKFGADFMDRVERTHRLSVEKSRSRSRSRSRSPEPKPSSSLNRIVKGTFHKCKFDIVDKEGNILIPPLEKTLWGLKYTYRNKINYIYEDCESGIEPKILEKEQESVELTTDQISGFKNKSNIRKFFEDHRKTSTRGCTETDAERKRSLSLLALELGIPTISKPDPKITTVNELGGITDSIDMYDLYEILPINDGTIKTKLQFYILYTMTFIVDLLHDFKPKGIFNRYIAKEFGSYHIKLYKDHIIDVINKIYGSNIDYYSLCSKIYEIFDYMANDKQLDDIKQNEPKYGLPSDKYIITNIFEHDGYGHINGQGYLQELMVSILRLMGIVLQPIQPYSPGYGLYDYLLLNSVEQNTWVLGQTWRHGEMSQMERKILFSSDVIPSIRKAQSLGGFVNSYKASLSNNIIDNTYIKEILSTANDFDAGGSTSFFTEDFVKDKYSGVLKVHEYFTFTTDLKITILKYTITPGRGPTFPRLSIEEYLPSPENPIKEINPVKYNGKVKLGDIIDGLIRKNFNIELGICKTIGDKSRRDALYLVGKGTDNLTLFTSNDIISGMIGCIFFTGSVVSSTTIVIENTPVESDNIKLDVEYFGVNKNRQLYKVIENYRPSVPPSFIRQVPQGEYSQSFGKTIDSEIKYLKKLLGKK